MLLGCHVHVLGDCSVSAREALAALDASGIERGLGFARETRETLWYSNALHWLGEEG